VRLSEKQQEPTHVAEHFTNRAGSYVKREDTVKGFAKIVDGQLDEIPEQAFYMVGTIDEVIQQAGHGDGEGTEMASEDED